MRNSSRVVRSAFIALIAIFSISAQAVEKEWTMLVFLNGNNNLDTFGTVNLKQMETVGSTDDLNIVVQWASEASTETKRMLVTKNTTGGNSVTSPVVQTLPRIDMGDYQQLIEFVKWGVANYPAKHYFIDLWNHGGGWHRSGTPFIRPFDISYDDFSKNSINTPQLGIAMEEIKKIIGHNVDFVASDACLMAMGEVAFEVANSVDYYGGSEENEPARGWPYDKILQRWVKNPKATPRQVGQYVAEEMVQSYIDKKDGEVTYSILDLSKIDTFAASVKEIATSISGMSAGDAKKVARAANRALSFSYSDYVDFGDFVNQVKTVGIPADALSKASAALANLVSTNKTTKRYAKATGLSLWIPLDEYTYEEHAAKYNDLKFDRVTGWGAAAKNLATNSR